MAAGEAPLNVLKVAFGGPVSSNLKAEGASLDPSFSPERRLTPRNDDRPPPVLGDGGKVADDIRIRAGRGQSAAMVAKGGTVDLGVNVEAKTVSATAIDIVAVTQVLGHVTRRADPAAT